MCAQSCSKRPQRHDRRCLRPSTMTARAAPSIETGGSRGRPGRTCAAATARLTAVVVLCTLPPVAASRPDPTEVAFQTRAAGRADARTADGHRGHRGQLRERRRTTSRHPDQAIARPLPPRPHPRRERASVLTIEVPLRATPGSAQTAVNRCVGATAIAYGDDTVIAQHDFCSDRWVLHLRLGQVVRFVGAFHGLFTVHRVAHGPRSTGTYADLIRAVGGPVQAIMCESARRARWVGFMPRRTHLPRRG